MPQVAFPTKINKNSTIHHLVVRPINIAERLQWDTLMAKHHYLGFKSLAGKSIRYVAEIQGQWVALLVHRLISSAVDFGNLTFQPLGFSRFSFRS